MFVDGKCLGTLDRRAGQRAIEIPGLGNREAVLEVLVESMGHINDHIAMEQDRKGMLGAVTWRKQPWYMSLFHKCMSWPAKPQPSDAPMGGYRTCGTLL